MGLLGNTFNMPIMGFNPQQMLMQFLRAKSNAKTKNPAKAKDLVLEKFKNGNISRDEFEKFSYMARQFGVQDDVLNELNQYIK